MALARGAAPSPAGGIYRPPFSTAFVLGEVSSRSDGQRSALARLAPAAAAGGRSRRADAAARRQAAPPSADEPVTVRCASGHLRIVGRHGGRKLKKLWQELGVAPWRRAPRRCCFTAKRRLPQRTICL
ncbi:MAG: tRNA lysidine(34) synthetase TilS [Escherichia coli]